MTALSSSTPAAAPPRSEGRWVLGVLTPAGAGMAGLLGLAFVGLYFRWFWTQGLSSWLKPDDWAHAFFIPLISGYMIRQKRAELAALTPRVFWPGICPFLMGIMSYFFFSIGPAGNHMLQGFSVILTLFGLVLLLLGPAMMRHLFLPIAFLAFGITVSEQIMIKLTFPLQLMASFGAWIVLNGVGVLGGFMAERSGNTLSIMLNDGTMIPPLNVAEACSGMRMVVAFFALGATVAVLGTRLWWQRVALLLLPGLGLFMLVVWSLKRVVREGEGAAA